MSAGRTRPAVTVSSPPGVQPGRGVAVVTACVVLVVLVYRGLDRSLGHGGDIGTLFLTGLVTLVVFAVAVLWLRRATLAMETRHD